MTGYTKLFSQIITSTIWREPNHIRIVWVTMMALADRHGEVQASIPGLADVARVSIEECEQALTVLSGPDKYSRSKEHEGRRIAEVDGGWMLLNHKKYRDKLSADERREYFRLKKQEQRARKDECPGQSKTIPQSPHIAEAKADTEADKNSPKPPKGAREGKDTKRLPTTEIPIRIAKIFHRKLTTPWNEQEIRAYKKAGKIDLEDLALVERYYEAEMAKGDDGRHRRDIKTLLNNFLGEVDRARAWAEKQPPPDSPQLYDKW